MKLNHTWDTDTWTCIVCKVAVVAAGISYCPGLPKKAETSYVSTSKCEFSTSKCECGSATLGSDRHSDYCPKYKRLP